MCPGFKTKESFKCHRLGSRSTDLNRYLAAYPTSDFWSSDVFSSRTRCFPSFNYVVTTLISLKCDECQAQTFSPNFVSLALKPIALLRFSAKESSNNKLQLPLATLMFLDAQHVD